MKKFITVILLVLAMVMSTAVCFADSEPAESELLMTTAIYGAEEPIMTILSAPTDVILAAPEYATRASVIKAMWERAGEPYVNYAMNFADVDEESEYAEAIRWAASEKIALGSAGYFKPEETVTRQELACFIYRYEQNENDGGFKGSWMFLLDVEDRSDIASWASEAVHWVFMNDIITKQEDGYFYPAATLLQEDVDAAMTAFFGPEPTIVGGWTEQDTEMTEELQAIFDKAVAELTGVGYTAKKLIATQVVAGINYKFLCDATVVYPGAETTQKVVTIYKDLSGNATITDVSDYVE